MRIGVLTTSYPRDADDWAGGFVRDRVRALVRDGATVEVIAAGAPDTATAAEPGVAVVRAGNAVVDGRALFYGGGAPEVLEAVGARAAAAALVFAGRLLAAAAARATRWDAVESHWLAPCGLVGSAIARGRPHRAHAHGGDVALLERLPGGGLLARALAGSGAQLVFASGDLAARFARLCATTPQALAARVEPAPVDLALFAPRTAARRAGARRSLGVEGALILAVGRLVPIKGFDVLVRASSALPGATLVIVGAGPDRDRLVRLAAELGVTVRMPGALARPLVADWLAAADLFVQPSRVLPGGRTEGLPVAVREAIAVGVPVVASACGGLAELAAGDDLTLVPPGDAPALARAAQTALLRVGAYDPTHSKGPECAADVPIAPDARR